MYPKVVEFLSGQNVYLMVFQPTLNILNFKRHSCWNYVLLARFSESESFLNLSVPNVSFYGHRPGFLSKLIESHQVMLQVK